MPNAAQPTRRANNRVHRPAFLVALIVFGLEVLVATVFAPVPFIRGSVSDILVVILIFYGVLAFIRVSHTWLAVGVLALAWGVEVGQSFGLADVLGFPRGSLPSILIGTTFSGEDLVMYTLGCAIALATSRFVMREGRHVSTPPGA